VTNKRRNIKPDKQLNETREPSNPNPSRLDLTPHKPNDIFPTMTTAVFKYIDPSSISHHQKPWSKVDDGGKSYTEVSLDRHVINVRGQESQFSIDRSGFQFFNHAPANEKSFTDDSAVRNGYYDEVEKLLRDQIPGIKRVVVFDHTIRRRDPNAPRQPVQQVHVDQTPKAAETRLFRHLPKEDAAELVKGRYQIINVWRPIAHPATDFPLALVDWRTTAPEELIPVDLMFPKRDPTQGDGDGDDDDDRGKEVAPLAKSQSTEGYEARGETFAVAPSDNHEFYYLKDMTPDEALFIKCFDSRGQSVPNGKHGIASYTPHTAFVDPQTPKDAPGRQSIEVRCLVFYE
jgi:hypothetical protein